ncbi:AAA family ATPase [Paludisphaera mucosa]|uniref:Cytidylate kinase-like family protein n=1 Tax=Paludisphaera mucosa TaxID=3030827 RepID=A0ABT6FCH4_9BACT|nr:cytidylate kinase-like family protein [Paludisphaera mucosa]MDG3005262.1 cytidylate kinase-like family protein [Paludisphaera mucosa]
MGAWEPFSISTSETPPPAADRGWGGLGEWPRSVVRWLFGWGEDERELPLAIGGSARFQNICISREAGAGGGAIARMVGRRLGWKVFDHELLEAIAHRMQTTVDEVRTFDELAPSVIQDWLLPLREEHYAPQEAYLDHLAKLLEAIGRAGQSVLVGRGGGFLLPRDATLSVRIVAPLKARAYRLGERMGVSPRTARRAAKDLDARRAAFERTMHRVNSADPHNYDLVLDSNSLGLEIAAEVIIRAVEAGRPASTIAASAPGASPWTVPPVSRPAAAPDRPVTTSATPPPAAPPSVVPDVLDRPA